MGLADIPEMREIITAAATAEVADDKPAICGTVTLHCLDGEESVHLSMPMLDALLLLNSLRAIEEELRLQGWAEQIGCSATALEAMAAELQQFSDEMATSATALN